MAELYQLQDRLLVLRMPEGSSLVGKTLIESHSGDAFDLTVLEIIRVKERYPVPKQTMPQLYSMISRPIPWAWAGMLATPI